ncbi:hypothetical protein EAF00_002712 [Botryotinia globosa]|nr:hypothetical protein EAF00_002712 [Botryotinia globosa]
MVTGLANFIGAKRRPHIPMRHTFVRGRSKESECILLGRFNGSFEWHHHQITTRLGLTWMIMDGTRWEIPALRGKGLFVHAEHLLVDVAFQATGLLLSLES